MIPTHSQKITGIGNIINGTWSIQDSLSTSKKVTTTTSTTFVTTSPPQHQLSNNDRHCWTYFGHPWITLDDWLLPEIIAAMTNLYPKHAEVNYCTIKNLRTSYPKAPLESADSIRLTGVLVYCEIHYGRFATKFSDKQWFEDMNTWWT